MPRPNFIERFISRLISETLKEDRARITRIENCLNGLEADVNEIKARENQVNVADQAQEQKPLAASRPSWPRMKRYLEEQDIRAGLEEARAHSREDEGRTIARYANKEADRLEKYWKEKQGEI